MDLMQTKNPQRCSQAAVQHWRTEDSLSMEGIEARSTLARNEQVVNNQIVALQRGSGSHGAIPQYPDGPSQRCGAPPRAAPAATQRLPQPLAPVQNSPKQEAVRGPAGARCTVRGRCEVQAARLQAALAPWRCPWRQKRPPMAKPGGDETGPESKRLRQVR
ncbi:uncharacterized protein TrAtP1_006766 [Trichoderma atroviride]|uniref:uncharacterized protein n=1 Tax=Hypocrea atroviridis TaxID=63577 RepID=UPI00331DF3A5|nr:hypothetical protein TrAtP1_006766 [Trichoderma atroviride]